MRLDEFRRIKLRVIKNEDIIYDGEAEDMPDNLKSMNTKEIKIQPGLAEIIVEDELTTKEI